MRFLHNSASHRNLSTPALYSSQKRWKRSAFHDQSPSRFLDIDASDCSRLAVSDTPHRMLEDRFLGLRDGSNKYRPYSLHNNPLRAFILCIIHPDYLRSIFSWTSGYQREREMATYIEAERFQTSGKVWECRTLDIYV
jgi:hypothetical protein